MHILCLFFDYCCPVWANVSNSELSKIKSIQKRAAKIILKKSNGNSAVFLFNELKWLSFKNRLNYHIGVITYKILNGHTPNYMCSLISVSHNTSYNLRSSTNHNLAILKRPKTNHLQNTFGYSSRMVWNGIPLNIKKSSSINAFKAKFKLFLQNSQ